MARALADVRPFYYAHPGGPSPALAIPALAMPAFAAPASAIPAFALPALAILEAHHRHWPLQNVIFDDFASILGLILVVFRGCIARATRLGA